MGKTREDFQPEVGGFLDDSDGEITDAIFEEAGVEYAAQMVGAAGKTAIGVTITIESPDLERPFSQWYSIGGSDNWEISSDGREVNNIKNPDKHAFRKGSRGWDLVEAMAKAEGGSVEAGQELWAKKDKPYMTQAAFYTGNYHWGRKPLPKVGGGTTDVLLPVSFLGEAKGKATPVSVAGTEDLDKVVIGLVEPKMTERDVKTAVARNEELRKKENAAYMALVISGNKLEELEKAGKITKGPNGTYV